VKIHAAVAASNHYHLILTPEPSPKPRCHAASKEIRKRFRQALRAFVDMFREASVTLRLGNPAEAIFPKWSFRPSRGFVRTGEELDPLSDAGGSPNFAALAAAAA
jgi:hypothetical protein